MKNIIKKIAFPASILLLSAGGLYVLRLKTAIERISFAVAGVSLKGFLNASPTIIFKVDVGNSSDITFDLNSIDTLIYVEIGNEMKEIGAVKKYDMGVKLEARKNTRIEIPFTLNPTELAKLGINYQALIAQLLTFQMPKAKVKGTAVVNSIAVDVDIDF